MQLTLQQRFQNGIRATTSAAPFIGPPDPRYNQFMGISSGGLGDTPRSRIAIANKAIWVYAAIMAIGNAISFVPLKLYKKGKMGINEEIFDHPSLEVLQDINPSIDTPVSMRRKISNSLCIHGKSHWKIVRNPARVPKELYSLPVEYTTIDNRTGELLFRFQQMNVREIYPSNDILYFRYEPFDEGKDGQSPLSEALETVAADLGILNTQNAMTRNSARPSAIMSLMNKLNQSDWDRFTERINNAYAGAANAGKIVVIDNANDVKFQTVQLTPREMEWIRQHSSYAKDVCAAFGVPPMIAGDFAESSRLANAGAGHRLFWELCIIPKLRDLEEIINWKFLWTEDWGHGLGWERKQGLFFKHDMSDIPALREDENSRSQRAMNSLTSGATINEARRFHGLNPIEDDRGNIILVQQNLVDLNNIDTPPPDPRWQADTTFQETDLEAQVSENVGSSSHFTDLKQPDMVETAKRDERRKFKAWIRTHGTKNIGEFRFQYLSQSEQKDLLEIPGNIDDEIRSTLQELKDGME